MAVSENAHSWSTEELVGVLQKVGFFEGLPAEDLQRVAAIAGG